MSGAWVASALREAAGAERARLLAALRNPPEGLVSACPEFSKIDFYPSDVLRAAADWLERQE